MKTKFELRSTAFGNSDIISIDEWGIKIMDKDGNLLAYTLPKISEKIAIAILKALKSKHLKQKGAVK